MAGVSVVTSVTPNVQDMTPITAGDSETMRVDVEVDGVTRGTELSEDASLAERWVSSHLRSLFTYGQIFKTNLC